jgi:hypothetical protein
MTKNDVADAQGAGKFSKTPVQPFDGPVVDYTGGDMALSDMKAKGYV